MLLTKKLHTSEWTNTGIMSSMFPKMWIDVQLSSAVECCLPQVLLCVGQKCCHNVLLFSIDVYFKLSDVVTPSSIALLSSDIKDLINQIQIPLDKVGLSWLPSRGFLFRKGVFVQLCALSQKLHRLWENKFIWNTFSHFNWCLICSQTTSNSVLYMHASKVVFWSKVRKHFHQCHIYHISSYLLCLILFCGGNGCDWSNILN